MRAALNRTLLKIPGLVLPQKPCPQQQKQPAWLEFIYMYVCAKTPQYTDLCVKWNHIRLIRYFPRVIDRFIKFAKFPESVPTVALFYDTVRDVQHFDVVNVKS